MCLFRLLLLATVVAMAICAASCAVVVAEGDSTVNTIAPANNPYWDNVGQMSAPRQSTWAIGG